MDLDKLLHHIPRRFKMDDLIAGTNNFREAQKLGQGGFGGVYKCIHAQTNEIMAVKRISEGSSQGIKEFISEVSIVSRLRHRNLVQLLGWCHERDLAPECVASAKTSPESDVYSFGAVALEIASGKKAIRLVAWAWDLYGPGRLLEAADVRLNRVFGKEEMERLMVVGLWCSHPDAAGRPKMRQVLRLLKFEVAAPILPYAMLTLYLPPRPYNPSIYWHHTILQPL